MSLYYFLFCIGTIHYLSPEQALTWKNSSAFISCKTDLWAYGLTILEMCTNELLFEGGKYIIDNITNIYKHLL